MLGCKVDKMGKGNEKKKIRAPLAPPYVWAVAVDPWQLSGPGGQGGGGESRTRTEEVSPTWRCHLYHLSNLSHFLSVSPPFPLMFPTSPVQTVFHAISWNFRWFRVRKASLLVCAKQLLITLAHQSVGNHGPLCIFRFVMHHALTHWILFHKDLVCLCNTLPTQYSSLSFTFLPLFFDPAMLDTLDIFEGILGRGYSTGTIIWCCHMGFLLGLLISSQAHA